jgi:bifunctional non-homologous end joining protein LigD
MGKALKTENLLERAGVSDIQKSDLPKRISPMLACPAKEPFDREGWLFEVKLDGFRAIAIIQKDIRGQIVNLYSRNQKSFNKKFEPVQKALENFPHSAVLDGEIVVLDETGMPSFRLLQNYSRDQRGQLVYFIFDLSYLDHYDLKNIALQTRKAILKDLLSELKLPHILYCDHIEKEGRALFEVIRQEGLEGMIAKKASSTYKEGRRSKDWIKVKAQHQARGRIG